MKRKDRKLFLAVIGIFLLLLVLVSFVSFQKNQIKFTGNFVSEFLFSMIGYSSQEDSSYYEEESTSYEEESAYYEEESAYYEEESSYYEEESTYYEEEVAPVQGEEEAPVTAEDEEAPIQGEEEAPVTEGDEEIFITDEEQLIEINEDLEEIPIPVEEVPIEEPLVDDICAQRTDGNTKPCYLDEQTDIICCNPNEVCGTSNNGPKCINDEDNDGMITCPPDSQNPLYTIPIDYSCCSKGLDYWVCPKNRFCGPTVGTCFQTGGEQPGVPIPTPVGCDIQGGETSCYSNIPPYYICCSEDEYCISGDNTICEMKEDSPGNPNLCGGQEVGEDEKCCFDPKELDSRWICPFDKLCGLEEPDCVLNFLIPPGKTIYPDPMNNKCTSGTDGKTKACYVKDSEDVFCCDESQICGLNKCVDSEEDESLKCGIFEIQPGEKCCENGNGESWVCSAETSCCEEKNQCFSTENNDPNQGECMDEFDSCSDADGYKYCYFFDSEGNLDNICCEDDESCMTNNGEAQCNGGEKCGKLNLIADHVCCIDESVGYEWTCAKDYVCTAVPKGDGTFSGGCALDWSKKLTCNDLGESNIYFCDGTESIFAECCYGQCCDGGDKCVENPDPSQKEYSPYICKSEEEKLCTDYSFNYFCEEGESCCSSSCCLEGYDCIENPISGPFDSSKICVDPNRQLCEDGSKAYQCLEEETCCKNSCCDSEEICITIDGNGNPLATGVCVSSSYTSASSQSSSGTVNSGFKGLNFFKNLWNFFFKDN